MAAWLLLLCMITLPSSCWFPEPWCCMHAITVFCIFTKFLSQGAVIAAWAVKIWCLQASNLKAAYMHLTNYAVNKHNENFVSGPEADSSKWDFAMLR